MGKKLSLGPKMYVAIMFIFFYLPILVTMFFSFNASKSLTKFTGFSFKWYEKLVTDNNIISAENESIADVLVVSMGEDYEICAQIAAKLRDEEIERKNNLSLKKEEWRNNNIKEKVKLSKDDIREVISKLTQIPLTKITQSENEKLINLEDELHKKIVGQNEAIKSITSKVVNLFHQKELNESAKGAAE